MAFVKKWNLVCGFVGYCLTAHAEVTLDGSLGTGGNVDLNHNIYSIDASIGKQAGSNLFHSFGRFNLETGTFARFTGNGQSPVANIIARVTGGESSTINGTLQSTLPHADLYLINPAGLIFGPNAKLEIQGSFYSSTADYLSLQDGTRFAATPTGKEVLTSAPPDAFGFLDASTGRISLNGGTWHINPGHHLSLATGEIAIKNQELAIENGIISLTGTTAAGEVPILGNTTSGPSAPGDIFIDNAHIENTGQGGFIINAGNLTLQNTRFFANNTGPEDSAFTNRINVRDTLLLDNSYLGVQAHNSGRSGNLTITAHDINILGRAEIDGSIFADGAGGDVEINAHNITLNGLGYGLPNGLFVEAEKGSRGNAGQLNIVVQGDLQVLGGAEIDGSTYAQGHGGEVSITAHNILLDGLGFGFSNGIFARAKVDSTGNAGDLKVTALNDLQVLHGSKISGSTFGPGQGGNVTIKASNLTLTDRGSGIANGIYAEAEADSSGNAGMLNIDVLHTLQVLAGSEIDSSTYASGRGGRVNINAGDIILDGQGLNLANGLFTRANAGTGNAGDLSVTAHNNLHMLGGTKISGSTYSPGQGGNVTIRAGNLTLDAQGFGIANGIYAEAEIGSSGNAGMLDIAVAHTLQVLAGSEIDSSTYGPGNGGLVNIRAGNIILDGQGLNLANGLFTRANEGSLGKAGDLTVTAQGDLQILGGSKISVSTFAAERGGDVAVTANNITINGQGLGLDNGIFAEAEIGSTGDGGDLHIHALNTLTLSAGEGISSATYGSGRAGNINIFAPHVTLKNQAKISGLSATEADAGTIAINTLKSTGDTLNLLNGSTVSVESKYGHAGDINVYANRWAYLLNSAITTCSGCGSEQSLGSGGNIFIDPQFVILNNSQLIATAEYGKGGNINIVADFLNQSVDSIIDPSSLFGVSGTVSIQSQYSNIASSIAVLPDNLLDVSNMLSEDCGAVAAKASSFTVSGRGHLPLAPDNFLFPGLQSLQCGVD